MREKPRGFIINKKSDYLRGFGGIPSDDRLVIDGCFFSELFDSGEKETRWYKLASVFRLPVNCSMKVTFFATDDRRITIGDGEYDPAELIRSRNSDDRKLKAFSMCFESVSHTMAEELLLTELKGRYLFFAVQCVSSGGEFPEIYEMRLSFAPYMLTNFLPEIYRSEENSFLERYLAIFQSLYEDMEERIDHAAESYVPENPDYDFLKWLSDRFCIRSADHWNEEQLRYILKNAPRIYRSIGTKPVIIELCELYLGCRVEILEYYDRSECGFVNRYGIPEDKLFINPYVFTVIAHKERLSAAELDGLGRIIDACKPAHMNVNIITMSSTKYRESKLGENTVLTDGITLV